MRIGVLASGSGTILEAILGADLPVVVVLVDRPCRATEVAAAAGVPGVLVEREGYGADFDRVAYTQRVVDALVDHDVDLVVMAGFGTILAEPVHTAFAGRILNTHPALLPSFKGAHAIQDAFDAGVKVTGITVHFANEDYDKGPIVAQRAVEVREGDTLDDLEARIHEVEHVLYPEVLRLVAEGRVTVGEDRKVHIAPAR